MAGMSQSALMLFEIQPYLQQVMAVFITREGTTGPGEALDTKHKTLDLKP